MSENADLLIAAIALFGLGWIGADNWHEMKAREVSEYRLQEARINSGADRWCGYNAAQMRAACNRPHWLTANNESAYAKGKQ